MEIYLLYYPLLNTAILTVFLLSKILDLSRSNVKIEVGKSLPNRYFGVERSCGALFCEASCVEKYRQNGLKNENLTRFCRE